MRTFVAVLVAVLVSAAGVAVARAQTDAPAIPGTAATTEATATADAPAAAGTSDGSAPSSAVPAAADAAPSADAPDGAAADALPADALVAVTASGEHRFTVEIADDPIERMRGLMFREEMARDAGMLFIFSREDEREFWMRNTILPLDIVYADADGVVVSIARDTTPYSLDPIPSNGPAQFAFEVNAGVADEIGLAPGDRLVHRRIGR